MSEPLQARHGVRGYALRSPGAASLRSCSYQSHFAARSHPLSRRTIRSICRASTCSMPSFRIVARRERSALPARHGRARARSPERHPLSHANLASVGVLAVVVRRRSEYRSGCSPVLAAARSTASSPASPISSSRFQTLMMAIIVLALFRAGLGDDALSRDAVPLLVVVIGLPNALFRRTARAATQVEAAKVTCGREGASASRSASSSATSCPTSSRR